MWTAEARHRHSSQTVRPVKFYGNSFPISFVFGVIPYSFGTVHCITITETNCRPLTRCHALKQKRFTVWIYYRHESSIKTPHAVQRLAWLLLSLVYPTWRTSGGCWVIVTSVHTLYCSTRNHFKTTQAHDSDATLARHIARFAAIATSCGSATPWQSLNRLPDGYITESDTSAMSAHRTILSAGMRSTCPR